MALQESKSRVLLADLLTERFLKTHSDFTTLREMLEASPFQIQSKADFDNLPHDELDQFIAERTDFDTWQEMVDEATYLWFKRGFEANQQQSPG